MKRLRCWLNLHEPNREHVDWDGMRYIGTCVICGAPIKRVRKGTWRKDTKPRIPGRRTGSADPSGILPEA
jgi:hypothetical protein